MKLSESILGWQDEMVAIRRDLHAHPELAYQEVRTSDLIAEKLSSWGIPIHRGMGVTGIVGVIEGRSTQGARIGLRADMDALPMQELNSFSHASTQSGRMHACGHDGHMTMLLSAARELAQKRDFDGIVYVIFQPAEEGHAGAKAMINDGLFQRFPMDAVFGMHNWPGLATGQFAVLPGPVMASSNVFAIRLKGKGGHAAMPHLGADPIMAAVQLAQSLQTLISRETDPQDAAVLSITQIHAGSADNVIPDDAILQGTVRTFTEGVLDHLEKRMADLTQHIAQAMQCTVDFDFQRVYPPTINHTQATEFCRRVAASLVGDDQINDDLRPSMGAEDFAFMLQALPGCYVWIGNGQGAHRDAGHGGGPCTLHNGSYDFNDDIIPLGASYWVALARQWLAAHPATD